MPVVGEVPPLLQIRAGHQIHASSQSVEAESCECGSVRAVSFDPLVVRDRFPSVAIWYLAESPEVLILSSELRDLLMAADPDLECDDVVVEGSETVRE